MSEYRPRPVDRFDWGIFAMTRIEALVRGCCIRCASHLDIESLSEPDACEWRISALCPGCYAEIALVEE